MKKFICQILSGTNVDLHGESMPKEFLESLCDKYRNIVVPLHKMHDMSHDPIGYIENFRMKPHEEISGEWNLVGDVTVLSGDLDEALRGFSISFVDQIKLDKEYDISAYIPYPYYNDYRLIGKLLLDQQVGLGRWVKKSYDPQQVILLLSELLLYLGVPVWDSLYKNRVAPYLDRFVNKYRYDLLSKNLKIETIQYVVFENDKIELRFMPPTGRGEFFTSKEAIENGIRVAERFLISNKNKEGISNIKRIVLEYDVYGRTYEVRRYELSIGYHKIEET